MQRGFTLIELLIVIALIAILASTIIIGLNPARQFAQARNAERWVHLNGLATATHQNRVENNGIWNCASGALPETATVMRSGAGGYDACPCLVPQITRQLGFDPTATGAHYTNCADYDTGYTIMQSADERITIAAPSAELGTAIGVTQ